MKKTLLFSGLLALSLQTYGQRFEVISQDNAGVSIGYELSELPFQYVTINGQQQISFGKSYHVLSMEKGAPALPLFNVSVQLPAKGNSILIVESDDVTEIQGVEIAPSKGNLKRNVEPSSIAYTFGDVYQQNAFYPANVASLNEPFVWRSKRGQTITVSPYQYNPVTKVLRVHHNLRVRVVFQEDIQGLNEIKKVKTDNVAAAMQQRFFINNPSGGEKYTPLGEEGEMLVISSPDFTDEMQPLVNWKNQKGIKTVMVTTNETGTTDTQIKAYVQNYYDTHPNLIYLLIAGDHSDVPAHTYGMSSDNEELWSDSYYGQLAGGATDFYPEVFVGRFSGNADQITLMVNRTLEYEINPAPGDWMEKAVGLGSGEGAGIGDDGEADWQHLRNIRTRLMSFGYSTVYEFYDGSRGGDDAAGNPNSTVILPAVNGGVGLFNYTGHGDVNLCVTGSFTSTNVNAETNNGMYPLVISVACSNGEFTIGNCISEVWMRSENAGSPAGAIGAAGSSILMAWAQPMQTQDEMAEIIAEAYPDNHKTTIGGLFYNGQMSMLEQYPGGSDGKEVMETWVFFGDPSTQFRNKQTLNMTVTHAAQVPLGTTSLTVNSDVDGAVVAVSQDNVLLGKTIATGGTAVITFPALASTEPLAVVATKQNYVTYRGPVQVGNGPAGIEELSETITLWPNPAKESFRLAAEGGVVLKAELLTITGQRVAAYESQNGQLEADLSPVAAGSYLVQIATEKGVVVKRLEIVK